jgi:hypothetical protein
MRNDLNVTINVPSGTDPEALAASIREAIQARLPTPMPVEAFVAGLQPGEALLCSEPGPRELPEAIHAVSQAIHAVRDHNHDVAHSLAQHLKALVAEQDRRLVPAPVCHSPEPSLRALFDQIGSRIGDGPTKDFSSLIELLAELVCVDGRYGVVTQRDLLSAMRVQVNALMQNARAMLEPRTAAASPGV